MKATDQDQGREYRIETEEDLLIDPQWVKRAAQVPNILKGLGSETIWKKKDQRENLLIETDPETDPISGAEVEAETEQFLALDPQTLTKSLWRGSYQEENLKGGRTVAT